jgi:hypothetical protein
MLLQTGRILLPRTAEADALARELLDYEMRVSEDANAGRRVHKPVSYILPTPCSDSEKKR